MQFFNVEMQKVSPCQRKPHLSRWQTEVRRSTLCHAARVTGPKTNAGFNVEMQKVSPCHRNLHFSRRGNRGPPRSALSRRTGMCKSLGDSHSNCKLSLTRTHLRRACCESVRWAGKSLGDSHSKFKISFNCSHLKRACGT